MTKTTLRERMMEVLYKDRTDGIKLVYNASEEDMLSFIESEIARAREETREEDVREAYCEGLLDARDNAHWSASDVRSKRETPLSLAKLIASRIRSKSDNK